MNTEFAELVVKAAASAASNFPNTHDVKDVEQELFVWAMENEKTVDALLRNDRKNALFRLLFRAANSYLIKEDEAVYGYRREDTFTYSTDAVRAALAIVFDYEDWQSFGAHGDGQPRAKAQANQSGDHLAMLVDVKAAVDKITPKQRQAVVLFFGTNYTYEMIGEEAGITAAGARDRVERGVQAIRKILGGEPLSTMRGVYDPRRGRPSIAGALARTKQDYEG